jgi:hypothetical protein
MIELNPDSVRNIVNHAREFQVQASMEADTAPETIEDDQAFERLTQWHGDERYLELKTAIEDLEPDQQRVLVALMWLGRGDFDDWNEALASAEEASGVSTADYLIATPLLADYLDEGLSQHGYEAD